MHQIYFNYWPESRIDAQRCISLGK